MLCNRKILIFNVQVFSTQVSIDFAKESYFEFKWRLFKVIHFMMGILAQNIFKILWLLWKTEEYLILSIFLSFSYRTALSSWIAILEERKKKQHIVGNRMLMGIVIDGIQILLYFYDKKLNFCRLSLSVSVCSLKMLTNHRVSDCVRMG